MAYGPAPEDTKLVAEWLDRHHRQFGQFMGGEFTPVGTNTFPSYNPSTAEVIATVSQASAAEVDRAVRSAEEALAGWRALGGEGRAKVLYAIARQIQKNSRLFAVLETLDNGKPIRESRDLDIPLVARHFYFHAGAAITHEPAQSVGVCGQIIPWNFPLLMLAWKIAPALSMGNTVVLKPAEFTSLTALLFAEICVAAGVPAGVVNIITGDGEVGRQIVEHPLVNKIAFTGSTEVGRILRKSTAGTEKKLSLELGGKSPYIIFEDADLDSAVEGLVDAIWFNQGQVCCAGSRLLVQESIAEKVYAKIRTRMSKLRVGNPLDKAVDVGAIIDSTQLERIRGLVEAGVTEGATLFQSSESCPTTGWFYPPTLLTNVSPSDQVAQVEIFGPVLVAMTFRTPAEAVTIANNTPYGLAATIWSENLNVAHDTAAKVKAGTVWVNCTNFFDASSGFGGFKESGYGREGGIEGLAEYVRTENSPQRVFPSHATDSSGLDRTHKLFVGGKQVRPDGGFSFRIDDNEFARANRKDVRNAVEAAANAQPGWANQTAFLRSQILYYLAENLENASLSVSPAEKRAALSNLIEAAAWTDKFEGSVHAVPMRALCYTRPEPIGVAALVCPDEASLADLLRGMAVLISMGNTVIAVPSETNPLPAAELYRVLEASDVPAGVINILTGPRSEIVPTLAQHDQVDVIWVLGHPELAAQVQKDSVGNLKQTWCPPALPSEIQELLTHATQVKNVWVPYGA